MCIDGRWKQLRRIVRGRTNDNLTHVGFTIDYFYAAAYMHAHTGTIDDKCRDIIALMTDR